MAAQETVVQNYIWSQTSDLRKFFLKRIMCEALDDHEGSVSIGGRIFTNM